MSSEGSLSRSEKTNIETSGDTPVHSYDNLLERYTSTKEKSGNIPVHSYDDDLLERYISNNDGVKSIVESLSKRAGALGPLEEPYDLQKVETVPDEHTTFNAQDPWQYPIDKKTKLRLVEFLPGDKSNPKNMPKWRKWCITFALGSICFVVAFSSAVVTGDIGGVVEYFGVSVEVVILASVTVFVIGFGVGPCVFAPLSEQIGRQIVYVGTLGLALVFIVPCGAAKNIGTLIVCRLIDGILFSAPMTLIGGSLADIWEGSERGQAMAIFSAAPFLGPVCGPIFGGLLGDYAGTWRWIYWADLIIAGVFYIIFILVVPETHHNTILKRRSKMLRKSTGDETYRAICELQVKSIGKVAEESLLRPFILLKELIVFLMTLYMSIVYGLLYMFFFAYPVVFLEGKGFSDSKTGVMFIPIGVGVLISTAVAPFINKDYNRRAQKYRDKGEIPPAELRLIPMMVGCWFVPASLFAFAWSSYPRLSWAGPSISGLGAGFGFCTLYNPANNYIVDSYQHYAASALAAKTLVRSIWGACVPLFTIQMYHRLGYEWASSLMAFISLACCAIPYLFYIYGARIRTYSKYAYAPESTN